MTKTDLLPIAAYFVAISGGYLWGMSIAPVLNLNPNFSSILGMLVGGIIAYSYLRKK